MGVFDSIKASYKKQQEKSAELKETRGKRLAGLPADYMGGYGDSKKATGILTFYENQTEFKVVLNSKSSFNIPNSDISDIAIEGKDEVNRRVTVTRLLAVGIFAFALKKKSDDKEAFITLELVDGQEVILHINNKSPMELKATISRTIFQVKQNKRS